MLPTWVSPKKTWEGAVGGLAGAVVVAVAFRAADLVTLAWVHVVVIALLGSIVGQVGDLFESRLKRSVGAKDSGTILPGHPRGTTVPPKIGRRTPRVGSSLRWDLPRHRLQG